MVFETESIAWKNKSPLEKPIELRIYFCFVLGFFFFSGVKGGGGKGKGKGLHIKQTPKPFLYHAADGI